MKYKKFVWPKDMLGLNPKKIISLNSIGEFYIGFEKPKKRRRTK